MRTQCGILEQDTGTGRLLVQIEIMPFVRSNPFDYHPRFRNYISRDGNTRNWLQYAVDHKEEFVGSMKIQIYLTLAIVGLGAIAYPLCTNIEYVEECKVFINWTKSGTNIWMGGLVLIFALYGRWSGKQPTQISVKIMFTGLCTEEFAALAMLVCNAVVDANHHACSVGIGIIFFIETILWTVIGFSILTIISIPGSAVEDDFCLNCRSGPDSDDEDGPVVTQIAHVQQNIRSTDSNERGSTYSNATSNVDQECANSFSQTDNLSAMSGSNDPPPSYEHLFGPDSLRPNEAS